MMSAAEDEVTQQTGIIVIMYNIGSVGLNDFQPATMAAGSAMLRVLPIRYSSFHYCFSDPRIRGITAIIMIGAGSQNRARFRLHEGKIRYFLLSKVSVPIIRGGGGVDRS